MAYNTRKKIIKFVKDDVSSDNYDYSASESDFEASESSSSEEVSTEEDTKSSSSESSLKEDVPKKTMKKMQKDKMYVINSDNYFSHSSQKKVLISNNALDKLETPRLQQDELQKLLQQNLMIKHKFEEKELEKINNSVFLNWLCLLHEGFNVLVYGLGSKLTLLRNFQEKYLNKSPVVVVNGFFPSLSVKNVVEGLMEILEINESSEDCDLISQALSRRPTLRVYLIVHNIEGDMLKNNKAQSVLANLAAIHNLHLIASIDNVSAPLIWDNSKLSKFNFIWFDVTTFHPYINETSFEGSLIVQRSKTLALSSLNNVFLSLTVNSKGIYLIIVKYQLENGRGQHYHGYLFKDLYWACREAFLVSSDLALRSQLTEFVDHKMLKFRRPADGSEYVIIPTAANILQQFYDQQSQN